MRSQELPHLTAVIRCREHRPPEVALQRPSRLQERRGWPRTSALLVAPWRKRLHLFVCDFFGVVVLSHDVYIGRLYSRLNLFLIRGERATRHRVGGGAWVWRFPITGEAAGKANLHVTDRCKCEHLFADFFFFDR